MPSVRAREHDNRKRVYSNTRAITNRARGRAMERLKDMFPVAFETIYQEELDIARTEIGQVEKANKIVKGARSVTVVHANPAPRIASMAIPSEAVHEPAAPAVLLKTGPKPDGTTVADKIRTDVGSCQACIGRHDADHICPVCGSRPQVAIVQKRRTRPGWSAALERDLKASRI